jgi:hypothetical protein
MCTFFSGFIFVTLLCSKLCVVGKDDGAVSLCEMRVKVVGSSV